MRCILCKFFYILGKSCLFNLRAGKSTSRYVERIFKRLFFSHKLHWYGQSTSVNLQLRM